MDYKVPPPPEKAGSLEPREARELFRRNGYHGTTAGFCSGHLQANLVALPASMADDFEAFCRLNTGPLPLLYRSKAGESSAPPLAKDSDVKTDLPRYVVYSQGRQVEDMLDLCGFEQSWGDFVSFYLGCSFTFEGALSAAGVRMKHVLAGTVVSMYLTNVQLKPVGRFGGQMFTSMRPIKRSQLSETFRICSQFPDGHGPPIHIGNPARIGVADIQRPSAGDPSTFEEDEVPVFWACGFSVSEIVKTAAPQLAFTHYSGSMFIADVQPQPKEANSNSNDVVDIVKLSREGQCFFASVLERKFIDVLLNLERSALDDPGKRGVVHLYQECDLVKAALSLSHAQKVAITTGFPVFMDSEVKEETDGIPGALSICQALGTLGKEDVVLICNHVNQSLFQSCVDHAVREGMLGAGTVRVLPYSEVAKSWEAAEQEEGCPPPWDCLVAIEKTGRNKDGDFLTMKARPLSRDYVEPVDDLFVRAASDPLVSTISIGDGGNEVGMGKVYDQVVRHIPEGDKIACATCADFVIASGVSNWGGHALSLALYVVSSSPAHWRYRNRGIDADHAPSLDARDFVPSLSQLSSLLRHMNELGFKDGMGRSLDQSVDGLPLQIHLNKLTELLGHVTGML